MIFWLIISQFLLLFIIVATIQYAVNKRQSKVSGTMIIFLFAVFALMVIIVVSTYIHTVHFCNDFIELKNYAASLNEKQDYICLSDAVNMNYQLYKYQNKMSFFMPYDMRIRELTSIELKGFNIEDYTWWE